MTEFNMAQTGQRIKDLRNDLQLSQKELGMKIGVAANTICQYESGMSETSLGVLVNLAVILKTSTDYLLGLED